MNQQEMPFAKHLFMRAALDQAQLALEAGEIPVGCVIVLDNEIIASGHNRTNETRNGTKHAEIVALEKLFSSAKFEYDYDIIRRCDLYVTCEPCIMCAATLSKLGIREVNFGCSNDRFGGNGSILSIHHINSGDYHQYPIHRGLMEDEAISIFQKFYMSENRRAPESKRKRKRNSDIPIMNTTTTTTTAHMSSSSSSSSSVIRATSSSSSSSSSSTYIARTYDENNNHKHINNTIITSVDNCTTNNTEVIINSLEDPSDMRTTPPHTPHNIESSDHDDKEEIRTS